MSIAADSPAGRAPDTGVRAVFDRHAVDQDPVQRATGDEELGRLRRISPSPDWFDDMELFASTKPATPAGAR